MKNQRIVLASVLKPIDDTRMFEKIGASLSRLPGTEIFIIGFPSKQAIDHPAINFISIGYFKRLSIKRALTPLYILKKTYKVKPDILIVNTHELLIVACLNKILFGTRIIYDIQENYWRNIIWTNTYPPGIRHLLALYVRLKEVAFSVFFDHFFLAENCFEREMKFFKKKYTVLENKSLLPADFKHQSSPTGLNLIFTGTISESTGIFESISLATALHELDASVRLHIIGYCAQPETLKKLRKEIENKPFISLTGGDKLVPHSEIISNLITADFGIIYYHPSPHTENKIPTKLYEYLSAGLPILLQNNSTWAKMCDPFKASITVNFKAFNAAEILRKMKTKTFYSSKPTQVTWDNEEKKLIEVINNLNS